MLHDDHGIGPLEVFRLGVADRSVQQLRELVAVHPWIEIGLRPAPGRPR
jgi:hypothetical protein